MYPDLIEKAVTMYHGHFLGEEGDKPWAASLRERLRAKYLRTVNTLGEYWFRKDETQLSLRSKQAGQSTIKKAIECFQRGLEIDDVAEEFYQNLIICHQRLGNKAEAVKVYKRCRDTLFATLGVEPSEKTRSLYNEVMGSPPPNH